MNVKRFSRYLPLFVLLAVLALGIGRTLVLAATGDTLSVTAPATATPGTPFSVTVTAQGATGADPTYTGTVTLASSDPTATLPPAYTFTVADGGTHTFTNAVTLKTAGNQTVSATSSDGLAGGTTVSVAPAATTATLTSAPNPSAAGQAVTFTATVASAGIAPTGTVTFKEGATTLGTGALNGSGVATFTTTALTAGTAHTITASYGGDANNAASQGTATQTVNAAGTTTKFSVTAPATATIGTAFSITVTALDSGGNTDATYNGTVHFTSSDKIAALPADAALTNGTGTFSVTLNSGGNQTITVNDTTSGNLTGSAAVAVATGNASLQQFTVASTPNPSTVGRSVTFTATLGGNAGAPTGTVAFFDNTSGTTVALGSAPLVAGAGSTSTATFATAALPAGVRQLSVVYSGDANYATKTATYTQTVDPPPTKPTITLTSSKNPAAMGTSVTFMVMVADPTGFGIPAGTVDFQDNGNTLNANPITLDANGVARFTTSTLAIGTHPITAVYNGDPKDPNGPGFYYTPGTSNVVNELITGTVNPGITLTSDANPSNVGQTVTFKATITDFGNTGIHGTPTGTVSFYDGTRLLGTVTLPPPGATYAPAIASFSTSTLAVGTHPITAVYSGDGSYVGTTSPVVNQVVGGKTVPNIKLSAAPPSPQTFGTSVTFTANVNGAGGVAVDGGTVTFFDGKTPLGAPVTVDTVSGVATFTTSTLAIGTHPITAVYSGDNTYTTVTSAVLNYRINSGPEPSKTTLASDKNPSLVGDTVTFTAVVADTSINAAIPTGSVTFRTGTLVLGTAPLDNTGTATLPYQFNRAGTYPIVAVYAGDSAFKGNGATLTQVVNPAPGTSATFVTSNNNPAMVGSPITFTIRVVESNDPTTSAAPNLVTLRDGVTVLDRRQRPNVTSDPNNGTFVATYTYTTSSLAVGTHLITATYDGDDFNIGSRSAILRQIVGSPVRNSRISVTSDINPSTVGTNVTFTATVQPTAGGPAPTGTIIFKDAGTPIGTGTLTTSGNPATTTATFATSKLAIGTHPITVQYLGDANNAPGTSDVYEQFVTGTRLTALKLTASPPSPQTIGTAVTFTATVTDAGPAPAGPTPTGFVRFQDTTTGRTLGTIRVNANGVATLTTATLTNGTHTIVATYLGDATYASSKDQLDYVIEGGGTTPSITTLKSSVNPSGLGQPVTFTATVTDQFGLDQPAPTGAVAFYDGNTLLGEGGLNASGVATFTTSGLAVGVHPITAVYTGDTTYASSESDILYQVVNALPPGTTLTSDINPSQVNQLVTFTATVTGNMPTGTVNFYDSFTGVPVFLGTGTVDADGNATLAIAFTVVGVHPITATYMGDANNATSTSATYNQTVEDIVVPVPGGSALSGPTPASWPLFHAGGTTTPLVTPVAGVNPIFAQLQGTPTGVETDAAGNTVAVQIPPYNLGNYDPARPPAGLDPLRAGVGVFSPNHFRDGGILSWSSPFSFLRVPAPGATDLSPSPAPPPGFATTDIVQDVQNQPTAINATDFPEITHAKYYGIKAATLNTPDTIPVTGAITVTGRPAPTNPAADKLHAIRQVVYYGRAETVRVPSATPGDGDVIRYVGAIYCVDGFTGGVIWRYQTPTVPIITEDADGNKVTTISVGPVFSTPAVARINVFDSTTNTTSNRLVVVVGDNNGFVYCLDAVGLGDGTSNSNSVDPTTNQPIYLPPTSPPSSTPPHVGNTQALWIYRPDGSKPRTAAGASKNPDPNSDLPIPQAFGTASPTIYIDPTIATNGNAVTTNATVLIGNSNGTLYALDGLGVAASTGATGTEAFDASIDLRQVPTDPIIPTCNPKWWFTVRGTSTDSNARIEGAPAILSVGQPVGLTVGTPPRPTAYIGTSEEMEGGSNAGRLYALDIAKGPQYRGLTTGAATSIGAPGETNYNVGQRSLWSFPNAWQGGPSGAATNAPARPALGNISGSPVVFSNPDDQTTRIFVAANVGLEVPYTAAGQQARNSVDPRPPLDATGRIWAVNIDGTVAKSGGAVWAYPQALDPNDPASDTTPEPSPPMGAFLNSTPAMGLVQFPKTIVYGAYPGTPYKHTDATTADVKGRRVPMLYVGTRGTEDKALYAIDVDGTNDADRSIYRVVTPTGTPFVSSPTLIANATTAISGGNGGAIFITAGNTLYQFTATPVTNLDSTQPFPLVNIDRSLIGAGPISAPSVATADVTDLNTFNAPGATTPTPNGTDWVYVGDGVTGLCRGLTPQDQLFGVGGVIAAGILPQDPISPVLPDARFPLRLYLFDGTAAHPGNSTDMRDDPGDGNTIGGPNPVNSTVAVFEWGQNAYIRVGNVVPPGYDLNKPDPNLLVQDPDDPTGATFYGNGRDVTFQIGDAAGATTTQIIRATRPDGLPNINANPINTTYQGQNIGVFTQRTDTGRKTVAGVSDEPPGQTLKTPSPDPKDADDPAKAMADGHGWIGAFTYPIGSKNTRMADTPGARRHVTSATQTATRYLRLIDPYSGNVFFSPQGSIVLQVVTTQGQTYTATNPATGQQELRQTQPTIQPTFGVLNPLAARGGYVPVPLTTATPTTAVPIGSVDGLGPFRGVDPLMPTATPGTPSFASYNLQALTNGNLVYTANAPTSGDNVATTDPTTGVVTIIAQATNYPQAHFMIATSLGEISHGGEGDNAAPTSNPVPPQGQFGNANPNGLPPPPLGHVSSDFGRYAMNVADRSNLGLAGDPALPGGDPNLFPPFQIAMQREASHWNDNTGQGGPGSRVNPLPWEDVPSSVGINASADYPNIGANNITHSLINSTGALEMTVSPGNRKTAGATIPDEALPDASGDLKKRIIRPDLVQIHMNVPKHQPANLSLYDGANQIGIPPINPLTGADQIVPTHNTFPQGYVEGGNNVQRIFIDLNGNGRWDTNEPYREVQAFAGVPIDMTTRIVDQTTDIGTVPEAFGIQAAQFPGLQAAAGNVGFQPYNTKFQSFFKPVTAQNDGNVNLLNVHFDQKLLPVGGGAMDTLHLTSDPIDPLATIPAFDLGGVSGGLNYLLRSSLDTDLAAQTRNPGIVANFSALYPSSTFHKQRVGGTRTHPLDPTTLTVPDAPDAAGVNVPGFSLNQSNVPTLATDPNNKDANGKNLPYKALPFVSVAVPLGTPVGSYSQLLRLFEGYDPTGYSTYDKTTSNYNPLYPPQYNGAVGGQKTPTQAYNGNDSLLLTQLANGAIVPALPYSEPGTTVKVTVDESRFTDGATYGAVPAFDMASAGVNKTSAADYLPIAFRDFYWSGGNRKGSGDLSVYWTSTRDSASPTMPNYNIYGANLPYHTAGGSDPYNYFKTGNPTSQWWTPIGGLTPPGRLFPTNTTNTGLTIAHDQEIFDGTNFNSDGSAFGFLQNVTTVAPFQNNLYCYPVVPATGATGTGILISSDPAQAKSGVRGLRASGNGAFGNGIADSLWAFWAGGTRGRTALYYSSTTQAAPGSAAWTPHSFVLPIMAGLTSVSDPAPVLVRAPILAIDQYGAVSPTPVLGPVIEVTYSGVGPNGAADVYVSRYLPQAGVNGQPTTLVPVPFPISKQQTLIPDAAHNWYAGRDVAWARGGALDVLVNGTSVLLDPNNNFALLGGIKATYDKASGQLVFTNVALPTSANSTTPGGTVYVDLAGGRVRFSVPLANAPNEKEPSVTATFNAQARRVTASVSEKRANTNPTAFVDETYKPNAAPSGFPAVPADRYWFLYRKSGVSGDPLSATIYTKSQRLTAYVYDNNGKPVAIALDNTNKPIVSITDAAGNAVTDVDVDYSRGRLYFPIVVNGQPIEGQTITVTFSYNVPNQNGPPTLTKSNPLTLVVDWLDEPRVNDLLTNPPPDQKDIVESKLKLDTTVNESNISAFLDPLAYANVPASPAAQPHTMWLFWTSTRNGTADIYYETIAPRF